MEGMEKDEVVVYLDFDEEAKQAGDEVEEKLPDNVVDVPGYYYNVTVGDRCLLVEKNIPPDLLKMVFELLHDADQAIKDGNTEKYKTDLNFAIKFLDSILTLPPDHPSLKRTIEMASFPVEDIVYSAREGLSIKGGVSSIKDFTSLVVAAKKAFDRGDYHAADEFLNYARFARDGLKE